jgi:ribosome maturation factor RimP
MIPETQEALQTLKPTTMADRVRGLLEEEVTAQGYTIVYIQFFGKLKKTLRIALEHADSSPIRLDECQEVHKTISLLLDMGDLIKQSYMLEVVSPGLDRPLCTPQDYIRFQGQDVELEAYPALDNRRRFRGILESSDEQGVLIVQDPEGFKIPWDHIKRCRLIPKLTSDHCVKSSKKKGSK